MMKIRGPKRDEGSWRKLHNDELGWAFVLYKERLLFDELSDYQLVKGYLALWSK
jgi:hypothetical protein